MNVGKLRKLIEGLSDDTQIVVPAFDHSFREVSRAETVTAEQYPKRGGLGEWYDGQELAKGSKLVTVVVIE